MATVSLFRAATAARFSNTVTRTRSLFSVTVTQPSRQSREFHPVSSNKALLKWQTDLQTSNLKAPVFSRPFSTEAQIEDEDNVYYEGLVRRIRSGDMQMIDVRDLSELEEFGTIIPNVCHIPVLQVEAALKLSDEDFKAKYGHPKPKKTDENIVFSCKKGIRSLTARNTARDMGFKKARHYPGAWMEWARMNNLPSPKE
ncbi:thiosulfate sulfurtransferase/rhodanese-like domain-containing protein 3 [Asterias amurensis]|uniref:thiosulfate sulfurtransferase/rhodanese-like domain-containing protein 3 n=1 Tax=Asterias amurensis TaxID=7602 RepID=UPI003AB738A0